MLAFTGKPISTAASATAGRLASRVLKWFYTRGTILFAPNEEDVCMLKSITGRPCFLMSRGVDAALFRPLSGPSDPVFRLGYVGRLTPEKNVRFLAELGNALTTLGRTKFEFFIVGQGSEEKWLREHVPNAVFAGVLRDTPLAQAYASMDLFVFPSHTDTFGNVVLEALSSGVPAVVTSDGGPKFLVQNGVTGYVAGSEIDFIRFVNAVMTDTETHRRMRAESRAYACRYCWTSVFHSLFSHYQEAIQ